MKKLVDVEWMKKEAMSDLPLCHGQYNIKLIEDKRNATYVIETCLKSRNGGWVNFPVNIFYQETPPPEYPEASNYFGIYIDPFDKVWKICDGISATKEPIHAFRVKETGAFKWSHYRHDMREVISGLYIDGGRDYTKIVGDIHTDKVEPVELTIENGKVYYESI